MALGKRLKSILEEKGITILELSQITGISKIPYTLSPKEIMIQ